ncbi:MAG: sel1 repeat family protein [Alphaproteobacteria bacterium]|nr:sel1 repeat family protein [Alphaproteobacteria bacterium]
MNRALIALLLLGVVAMPAAADVAAGLEAFRRGDYEAARAAWQPLAESGNPVAQFNIGILYRRGLGVTADNRQAVGWFERAAVGGHTTAQFNLGLIYEQGIGVSVDKAAALRWYRRAAKVTQIDDGFEEARARAQFRLADLLLKGDSVNRSAGMYWLQRSGESGNAEAQFRLALAYAAGKDLVRDSVAAARWFERAAEQGHLSAQVNLATIYETGAGLSRDETKAAHWYAQAAEQNAVVAQINLGSLYAQGRGVARDDRAALKWYSRAANQGALEAYFNLGVLYEHSTELSDEQNAYFWYAVAAKAGHKKASLRLVSLRAKVGDGEAAAIERRAAVWRPQKERKVQRLETTAQPRK